MLQSTINEVCIVAISMHKHKLELKMHDNGLTV